MNSVIENIKNDLKKSLKIIFYVKTREVAVGLFVFCEKINIDIINKIYEIAPSIITTTYYGKFLFDERYQIYIDTKSNMSEIENMIANKDFDKIRHKT